MAIVPTEENLSYVPVQGTPRVEATPADFGAQIGQATQGLGQSIEQGSARVGDAAIRFQEIQNQIGADQAMNALQTRYNNRLFGDPNDPTAKGYFAMSGNDALGAYKSTLQGIDQDRQDVLASLSNPVARLRFDEMSRRLQSFTLDGVGRHYVQQTTVAQNQTALATEAIARNQAGLYANDDAGFMNGLADMDRAIRQQGEASGWSPEVLTAKLQAAHQEVWRDRVLRVSANDPSAAMALLQNNQAQFSGPVLAELNAHLLPKVNDADSRVLAGQAWIGLGPSSGPAQVIAPEARPAMLRTATEGTAVPTNVLDAVVQHESGWNASAVGSVGELGLGQVKPSTGAQPGYGVVPATPDQLRDPAQNLRFSALLLDGLGKHLGVTDWTDRDQVQKVLAAYNGGSGKDQYAADVAATAFGGAPNAAVQFAPRGAPDLDAMLAKIESNTDASPEVKQRAESLVTEQYHHWKAATAVQRAGLDAQLKDGVEALSGGHDFAPDPVAFRNLLTPAEQSAWLANLSQARAEGQATAAVRFAAPSDIQATMQRLQSSLNDPTDYRDKAQLVAAYQKAINDRNKALSSDPGAYVLQSPAVATALAKIDPQNAGYDNDPSHITPNTEAFVQASLAEQSRLGVPPGQQSILPQQRAASLAQTITRGDGDPEVAAGQISRMAGEWGRYWPQVFGELVKAGLPAQYQVIASMDAPQQALARGDYMRTLQSAQQMGGVAKMAEALPTGAKKEIDNDLDGVLGDFRATTQENAGGTALYGVVRQAVQTLAYGYVLRNGMAPGAAIQKAADGILNNRYDFDGTMRVPKGTLDQVQTATSNMVASLKPTDLADIGGDPNITPEQRQGIALDAARRGHWIPNRDDSGLVLMGVRRDGLSVPVRRVDGSPVELRFADVSRAAAAPVAPDAPRSADLPPAMTE